ncbi:hypothetical protein ColTof4_14328 [Colletotrichum tofieldiae]|nr:hypothetical protein ColTof3_14738 [Colletotrichum tofieldiae]GKT81905.1 hypothetical protein ColTof4_14328 [Colletotrichum tofieldiae]
MSDSNFAVHPTEKVNSSPHPTGDPHRESQGIWIFRGAQIHASMHVGLSSSEDSIFFAQNVRHQLKSSAIKYPLEGLHRRLRIDDLWRQ